MPLFLYEAKDSSGKVVRGSVEADDQKVALRRLAEQGYWVTKVKQHAVPRAGVLAGLQEKVLDPIFKRVGLKERALFFRQLHSMVASGLTLVKALDVLERNTTNARLRSIVRDIAVGVERGQSLSARLARHPTVFNEMVISLVKVGEQSGALDSMLRNIADYLEREMETRRQISRETIYPKLVLLCALFIPTVVPLVLGGFVAWLKVALPIALVLGGAYALYVVLGRVLMRQTSFAESLDHILLAIPWVGTVIRKLSLARFARALSAMYNAAMSLSTSTHMAAAAAGNAAISAAMRRAGDQMVAGGKLTDALRATGMVPDMVLAMVGTGEETGNLGGMLDKVAEYYEDESYTSMRQMTIVVGILALLGVGVYVGLKVISFWMGHYGGLTAG